MEELLKSVTEVGGVLAPVLAVVMWIAFRMVNGRVNDLKERIKTLEELVRSKDEKIIKLEKQNNLLHSWVVRLITNLTPAKQKRLNEEFEKDWDRVR